MEPNTAKASKLINLIERTNLYFDRIILIVIIFCCFMIVQGILTSEIGIHHTLLKTIIGNGLTMLLSGTSFILNRKGKYLTGRFLFLITINAFGLWAALTFGRNTGYNLYFIVLSIIPQIVIYRHAAVKYIFTIGSILALVLTEVYFFVFDVQPVMDVAAQRTAFFTTLILLPVILFIQLNIVFKTTSLIENWLQEEEKKSNDLIRNILPENIIRRMRQGEKTIAQSSKDASVLFFDIVNFTARCAKTEPNILIQELNEIFGGIDDLIGKYNLEKIKTIGDAYFIASGMPRENTGHLKTVIDFAFDLLRFTENRTFLGDPLELRIGINAGELVGGVIGKTKYTYDIWGDTVNIAARLESSSKPGRIHITEDVYKRIGSEYRCVQTDIKELKSIGPVTTYFIEGR